MKTLHATLYPTATGVVGFLEEAGKGAERPDRESAEELVFELAAEYTDDSFEIVWFT